jgi:hypothetical protein
MPVGSLSRRIGSGRRVILQGDGAGLFLETLNGGAMIIDRRPPGEVPASARGLHGRFPLSRLLDLTGARERLPVEGSTPRERVLRALTSELRSTREVADRSGLPPHTAAPCLGHLRRTGDAEHRHGPGGRSLWRATA